MVTRGASVRRLDLGSFVRPAAEVAAFRCAGNDGAGCDDRAVQPRVEPVLGYVVRRDEGTILFDTGIGAVDAETEAHYRPRRRDLVGALATVGMDLRDITLVVNCHLHFDHCGGNALLAGRPILVQSAELASARGENYTVPELVNKIRGGGLSRVRRGGRGVVRCMGAVSSRRLEHGDRAPVAGRTST